MARHFVERARREARRRPLAAIRHTQQFNIFTEHKKYNSSKGSEGFLTTGFDGVADGATPKTANNRWASRRAAHCSTPHLDRSSNTWHVRSASSEEARGGAGAAKTAAFHCGGAARQGASGTWRGGAGRRESWAPWEEELAAGEDGRPAACRRTRGVLVEVAGQVKDDAGQGWLDLGTSSRWLEQGCTWGGGLPAAVPEGGAMGTWSSAPCCRAS
jgi:hypothetical protein